EAPRSRRAAVTRRRARRRNTDERPFPAHDRGSLAARRDYTERMEIVPGITQRRRALGICVMTVVPLLQLATEYLGTGDRGRVLSKLAVAMIGVPILIWGTPAGIRWAAGRRSGPLLLLLGGMLSAGALYAALLAAVHF